MKGVAYWFGVVILGLFSVTLLYIMLYHAWTINYAWATGVVTNSTSTTLMGTINNLWIYFPFALLFAPFFLVIARTQKGKG